MITESQKRAFITDALNFTENIIKKINKIPPFVKHCNDVYSSPGNREHHDFYMYYIQYKTCESSLANLFFTVVFNPFKNDKIGIFSITKSPRAIHLSTQVVIV